MAESSFLTNPDFNRYTTDFNSGWADDAGKWYRDTQKPNYYTPKKSSDYLNSDDAWTSVARGLRMAGDIFNRGSSGGYGGGFTGGGGIQQAGDITAIYPQTTVVPPGQSSSGGGLFGKVGGLAGTLGLAAGIFGPLGPAIGAGVGGLIDAARG